MGVKHVERRTAYEPVRRNAEELGRELRWQLAEFQKVKGALPDEEVISSPVHHTVAIISTPERAMYLLASAVAVIWADAWPLGDMWVVNRTDLAPVSDVMHGQGEACLLQLNLKLTGS